MQGETERGLRCRRLQRPAARSRTMGAIPQPRDRVSPVYCPVRKAINSRMKTPCPLALLIALMSCGSHVRPSASTIDKHTASGTPAIGMTEFNINDKLPNRPLHTYAWYPAEASTKSCKSSVGEIFLSRSCLNAPLAAGTQQLPLVLLSHGTGGDGSDLVWLAEYLVEHGYLAAAVDHFGNTFRNNSAEGTVAVWRRPKDLSCGLDALLLDRRFGPRIAATRIGAAGFSAGGYTVIALAGGIYHPELMRNFCREHPEQSDCKLADGVDTSKVTDLGDASKSYRDKRVGAVFAMAPAVGQGFDAAALAQVDIPVKIVAGVNDEMVPFHYNAAHVAQLIQKAQLVELDTGGHFVFMPICNPLGLRVARSVCSDISPSTDRRAIHDEVQMLAVNFFDANLR